MPAATEPTPSTEETHHQQAHAAISERTPQWLLSHPTAARQALRGQGAAQLATLAPALESMPDVLHQLHEAHHEHRTLDDQVSNWLALVNNLEHFAEPLLKTALRERFGLDVDVRRTWLLHPRRMQADDSFLGASRDWMVESYKAFRLACRPLLEVALQNFEAWEGEPGGMDLPLTKARIFTLAPGQAPWQGADLDIPAEHFVNLCRTLDLGGRYQQQIREVFEPHPAATQERQQIFQRHEHSGLLVHLHLARLRGEVGADFHGQILDLLLDRPAQLEGVALESTCLTLWNIELNGIVVFGADRTLREGPDRVVVYIPGDPEEPLREHASFLDFAVHLRDRLLRPDYLTFFQGFMPQRQRAQLLDKLQQAFHPKVWNPGGWYEQGHDPQASLPLRHGALDGPLLATLLRRKLAALRDDGLFLAVPTADEDHKSVEEKLDFFAQGGLLALNALAFAVPLVGAAMLVFGTVQLAHEVYEGIGAWTRDEHEQAWAYLLDVLENIALVGVLGAVEGPPRLPGALQPVRLPDGRTRLWNRDLTTFAHDNRLPGNLRFDHRGLRSYLGKQWLVLDGRHYVVASDADGSAWLEHPRRADAYRPPLRYQGGGVWLHELDRPGEWSGLALFKRFGAVAEGLDEEQAQQLLLISGCSESELRRALVDGQRPPALLLDCVERYRIHRDLQADPGVLNAEHHTRLFDMLYQAPGRPVSQAQALVLRDFPSLPRRIVQELLAHADAAELTLIEQQRRVPPRLAEEARVYLQGVRLARAYEGLYLDPLGNNDSTRLILHGLAALPGWAEQYRLEIRGLRRNGPLLDSIGPSPAVHRRVLVKNVEGYRQGGEPEGTPVDLFEAVFATLTAAQRESLGLAAADGSAALRRKVQAQPLSRPALRKVLHMQTVRPAWRSPMRLADGRPGYPLSGRGRLPVAIGENTLLDKIRLLELPDVFATDLLQQLRGIRLDNPAIDARLDSLLDEREQLLDALPLGEGGRPTGEDQPALSDRHLIELALWQHWRDNLLPEIGRHRVPLRLFAVSLQRFPRKLPEFFRTRVQSLELSGVRVAPAAMETDEDGLLRHKDQLQELFQAFPRVTALELDALEGRGIYDLPRLLVGAYPRLVELRLLNLHLPLDQQVLDELCRLGELRHLDLSGNRASHLPVALTGNLRLDFLGLDRLGLEHWPEWLDNPALAQIERVSLRDNHLTDLPAQLRENPPQAEHSTWISLRGNLFSHQALIGIRASAWRGQRFRFDLIIPRTVENIVEGMMVERDQLSTALERWHDTSRQAGTLDAERLGARRALGDTLFASWVAQTDGSTSRSLLLEDIHPEDFPDQLPAFYYARISRLELLRPRGGAAHLDTLVERFQRLEQLSISASPLEQLPTVLGQLGELNQLALIDTGLRVDQALIDQLSGLRRLTSLDLGGNRLGEISDATRLGQLSLHLLGLERMQISTWPTWLDALLPERVQWLNLNDNHLTSLPAHLLENAETASGFTEISLEGNPLSEETLFSASLSEGASRPYSFRFDVPEHIRGLGGSWQGSSSGAGSSGAVSESDLLSVEFWLAQDSTVNDVRRQHWRQLESGGDADDLLRLVGRLRHTADYRNGLTRPDLVERVWQVLILSAQDPELRLILNGMAEEPLRQLREHDTCPDGVRLEFNQMEILVYTGQALRAVALQQRGTVLYQLMRRLYRLNELDRIARREAGNRDEAEVRLAYRLNLANRLDLPLAPEQMLYAGSANLRAGELERAVAAVRQGENGQGLLDYAAQRDFWLEYLRDVHGARFSAIRQAFEARVLGLDDLYPDDSPVQTSARIQLLVDQRKVDEADLIRELTHEEGLKGEV